MSQESDPFDRPPGDLSPEETLRRLESLYGKAPDETPAKVYVEAPKNEDKTTVQPRVEQRPAPPQRTVEEAYSVGAPAPEQREYRQAPSEAPSPKTREKPSKRPRRKRRWYRPKLRWLFLYFPLAVLLTILGLGFWGWKQFSDIYRVDTADSLSPASATGTNYLIVGSDSRDGISADDPNIGVIGADVAGRRADTIIVLRVQDNNATMMSIPRDLWVTNAETGSDGRINGAYASGAPNLINTVTSELGIPIHHYMEVDFVSFGGMVDAVGGIDIEFEHPAYDKGSGLVILTAGVHRLDGAQALAYVRARNYTEIIDGREVVDPTGDLGRQVRQQEFIRKVMSEVGATKNPLALAKIARAASTGMRIDDHFGFFDAFNFALGLGRADMNSVVLPTVPARVANAAVLFLSEPAAEEQLALFEGGTG